MSDPQTPRQCFEQLLLSTAAPLVPAGEALDRLLTAGRVVEVPRSTPVLRAGDVADSLFSIHRGLLRYYYLDPETGDERTGQFFDEGGIITDAASFLTGAAATQTVETIEESVLFIIPKLALPRAYDEDHA